MTLLLVLSVFVLGCGDADETEAVEEEPAEEEPVEEEAVGVEDEPEEEIDEETETDENSRTNPAGLNEPFTVYKDCIFVGKATFELELLELVAGEEAWNMVREANQFNEEPGEGKEYILAKFRIKIIETEEDEPYDINHAQFDAVSAEGVTYDDFISISGLEPSLRNDLYEGAEHTGYTYFLIDENDTPVAAYDRGRESEIWFDLRDE